MSATLPVRGGVVLVDESDLSGLVPYRWCISDGYAVRCVGKRSVLMHRQILGAPSGTDVDHVNGDRLDNRRANLRTCTRKDNCRNKRPMPNHHGFPFKGVGRCAGASTWKAKITVDFTCLHLGSFDAPELAARAYDLAATAFFGDFARLNFAGRPLADLNELFPEGHQKRLTGPTRRVPPALEDALRKLGRRKPLSFEEVFGSKAA